MRSTYGEVFPFLPVSARTARPGRRGSRDDAATEIEAWSRTLADTMVDALLTIDSRTSPTQIRALLALEVLAPCSNAELAAALSIFPSSCTRITDRLTAAGWVSRAQAEKDRREVRLVLTPAGRKELARFVDARIAIVRTVTDLMSPSDRVALLQGLMSFTRAAEAVAHREGR